MTIALSTMLVGRILAAVLDRLDGGVRKSGVYKTKTNVAGNGLDGA